MSFAAWSQKERGEYTINSGTSTKSQLAVNYPKLTVEWVPLFCLLWFDKKKINGSISLTLQIFSLPKLQLFIVSISTVLPQNCIGGQLLNIIFGLETRIFKPVFCFQFSIQSYIHATTSGRLISKLFLILIVQSCILRTDFYLVFFRPRTHPRTFLQCFALDSRCSKAKHCRNVLERVLVRNQSLHDLDYRVDRQCCPSGNRPETPRRPP
jgi:hypothetical protein